MILDNANLPPVIETAPWMLADGGALDVDRCPDCWERRAHIERYAWAAQVCNGMRVLDFGCGTGYGSKILRANNHVWSFDVSGEAIRLGIERHNIDGWIAGEANARASRFDACVAFEVLEHLEDPGDFIRTVRARHLIASVPVRPEDANPHHKHHFTIESFKVLVETRFRIVSWWVQVEPFHNYASVCVVHGEEK